MKKIKRVILLTYSSFLMVPLYVFAQGSTTKGGLNYGDGAGNTVFNGLQQYINVIMPKIVTVGSALTVLMVVYGGFVYLTSQGQPDKITQAKIIITSALIGITLLLMSSYILDILLQR